LTVGGAGAVLTGRIFRAIDDVVRQARHIGEASLAERLPHAGTQDEIGRLVDTLNEMLSRLEQSFEVQRRFTADASHELRSPLSRLRVEIEVALRRPRDASEYVETLCSCLEEVDRLTRLVEELLALARLDAGQERRTSQAVSLQRLAQEALARLEVFARERSVHIALEQSSPETAKVAHAPASLVLANLLDNAVKFSPPGGRVTVHMGTDGSEAVVSVCDSGPGIRIDELPHLFERFYRGSSAHASSPGVGLGLALSQAIAQAHGGRIDASNLPAGGALFRVRLPLAA
jgi:two-component system OmpR family sensor kinase